jgi:Protein of unknown function (DUF1329)
MFKAIRKPLYVLFSCMLWVGIGQAQVTPEEAAKLKTTLTPVGAEKAGNKEGTIPPWTGGLTKPSGYTNGGRLPDPFAGDKPIFTITAKNMDQYADKLSDGTKALLKKYPDTFHLDVYETKRTFANPESVYENTIKNATRVKEGLSDTGPFPIGAIGGYPFPIPKNGAQVMWNGLERYQGITFEQQSHMYLVDAQGKAVMLGDTRGLYGYPMYYPGMTAEKMGKVFSYVGSYNIGPAIRAGDATMGHMGFDTASTEAWVYLTGQRRTRKLPTPCCDTPAPQVGGVIGWDDFQVFSNSHLERFDWILKGKKELYIPYNSNMAWQPTKDSERLMPHHLNPKYVRWELHRVWIVETKLKPGFRHQAARSVYYVDEDSWTPVLGDRWDASGHLWRTNYGLPMADPDHRILMLFDSGTYDLISGVWAPLYLMNEIKYHVRMLPIQADSVWAPASLAASGIR